MAAFKNKDNGTWYVQFRYTDWKGERQQKLKRGFATKREALEWEREFLMEKQADVNMTFESFVALYEKDIKPKLKLNTWLTKESIIKKKILPYFANRKLSEITAKDIIRWQNEIRELRDCHGKPLSKTYLKTVHNQLSAIFNHAARFYGLNLNPARQAGNMGAEERKEMLFWTREEYTRFSEAMMDKPLSFYAFEVLYWCGVREGELLALTPADFDFEKRTVTINKSYQRLNKQDVVTTPKTPKSNRVIQMPQFLCDELQDYLKQLYLSNEADEIVLVYQQFRSVLSQTPGRMTLLPVPPMKGEGSKEYIFEPDKNTVLDSLVELYISNTVYSVMLEAKTGEHAARMTAMTAATDNTEELISSLTLELNHARQSAITTEISEIVGGSAMMQQQ